MKGSHGLMTAAVSMRTNWSSLKNIISDVAPFDLVTSVSGVECPKLVTVTLSGLKSISGKPGSLNVMKLDSVDGASVHVIALPPNDEPVA